MRGHNLIQLIKVIDLLSRPGGATMEGISRALKVDRRTVYRWIDIVSELGIPVYDREPLPPERKKRWKIEKTYLQKLPNLNLPEVRLTLSEIIALYLLKGEEKLYKGTATEKTINSAFGKIGFFTPDPMLKQFQKIRSIFISSSKFVKDYAGKEDILDTLTEAMLKQKTCVVEYHSFQQDKTRKYKINPLHFFEYRGGLYFFARIPRFGDIRVLAVERIKELKLSREGFEYPKNFKPEELLDAAFGIVYDDPIEARIWFSAGQAKYIRERKWARKQRITKRRDDSIVLSMKTSGRDEVKRWAMSFGKEAEVLEPQDLREEICRELDAMIGQYRKGNPQNL